MISAVASEDGRPREVSAARGSRRKKPRAPSGDGHVAFDPSPLSWVRFSVGPSSHYELVTRGGIEVEFLKNGHCAKVFRGEAPILQTFWTHFHAYPGLPTIFLTSSSPDSPDASSPPSIDLGPEHLAVCVLEAETLRVFYDDGQDFLVSLPFPVRRCWPSKLGLILERDTSVKSPVVAASDGAGYAEPTQPLPAWFGLLHPLDDFSRILTRQRGGAVLREVTSDQHKMLHVSKDPSLCVTYNTQTGQHCIWHVRQSSFEERQQYQDYLDAGGGGGGSAWSTMVSTADNTASTPSIGGSRMSSRAQSAATTPSAPSSLNNSSAHPMASAAGTPKGSPAAGAGVVGALHSDRLKKALGNICRSPNNQVVSGSPAKPILRNSMLRQKRRRSVMNSAPSTPKQSPFASSTACPSFVTTPNLANSILAAAAGVEYEEEEQPYLTPGVSLCLDHVWSEPTSIAKLNAGEASRKVFVARDFHGSTYLCYLYSSASGQLAVIPVSTRTRRKNTVECLTQHQQQQAAQNRPDGDGDQLCVGAVSHISSGVLDADFVEELKMIIVLERSQSLVLYSGLTKVSCVSFNASPSAVGPNLQNIAMEISSLNLDNSSALGGSKACTPLQSRLFASSAPPSAATAEPSFNDSALSPVISKATGVAGSGKSPRIVGLRDAVRRNVTLEYSNSTFLRLSLPSLESTELVQLCVDAICSVLGKDMSNCLRSRWYACRNAPGPPCVSPIKEWKLFAKTLLAMIGYQTDHFMLIPTDTEAPTASSATSPEQQGTSKKLKRSESGSDGDWSHVVRSVVHMETGPNLSVLLGIDNVARSKLRRPGWRSEDEPEAEGEEEEEGEAADGEKARAASPEVSADTTGPLFSSLPAIAASLHYLYEDMKLDKGHADHLQYLAGLLTRLCADLNLPAFVAYYASDFPAICPALIKDARSNQISTRDAERLLKWSNASPTSSLLLCPNPPDVYQYLLNVLMSADVNQALSSTPFSRVPAFARRTRDLTLCFGSLKVPMEKHHFCDSDTIRDILVDPPLTKVERLVKIFVGLGYNRRRLETLPEGVALVFNLAVFMCRQANSASLDRTENTLIGRPDLTMTFSPVSEAVSAPVTSRNASDGMEDLEASTLCRLRWPADKRMKEVRDMLCSSRPVRINVQQRHEVSDHEFVEEQERCLQMICVRTMALPIGRGAVTLHTGSPLVTESAAIPLLCLKGRAPPRGTTVEMDHIDVVPNMERWPLFHNGVAAGLKLANTGSFIDSTWITFNKPADATTNSNSNALVEHAGFLMGLGLGGHLSKLGKLESFDYMIKGHDLISIGVLIGMAASKKGSMDLIATKKISTQLVALLPSSATELPISHSTQIAALISLGLLYQGTGHRHMAEVCLGELGRLSGQELEMNCSDRESYSLSAGLALGMITFGQGPSLTSGSLSDLELPDILHYHMIGGPRSAVAEKLKKSMGGAFAAGILGGGGGGVGSGHGGSGGGSSSGMGYHVREGDTINIDITGPGATLALGMMFFDSGNASIADWMAAPKTQFLLEFVRPDFLMLRTIARGLILWREIDPTLEWILSNVPEGIVDLCLKRPSELHPPDTDYETINQAYCNITSGAALVMAFRFAGSANSGAFNAIYSHLSKLLAISKRSVAELAGQATIEQTICVHVLALSLVMAGTGDLEVIRVIRFLRSRVGPKHSTVTYGSHVALHLSLGLLLLGGGELTLSTGPEAVAAMICAFYPKFPTHSNDNRYHLQALRHFYVLACDRRLVFPHDCKTLDPIYAHLEVEFAETEFYPRMSMVRKAPFLLPELKYITRVSLHDDRYHGYTFSVGKNWDELGDLLAKNGGRIYLQQKAGCHPYRTDPHGFRSQLAQSLAKDNSFQWSGESGVIAGGRGGGRNNPIGNFSSDPRVSAFCACFLLTSRKSRRRGKNTSSMAETEAVSEVQRRMASLLYECASQEKMELMPTWIETTRVLALLGNRLPNGLLAKQLSFFFRVVSRNEAGFVNGEVSTSAWQTMRSQLLQLADNFQRLLDGKEELAAAAASDPTNPLLSWVAA